MVRKALTKEEVGVIGRQIYADQLRDKVEDKYRDKYLVLDIDSSDYEIDARHIQATLRLLQRRPEGTLYSLRIGHPAAFRLGGSILTARS